MPLGGEGRGEGERGGTTTGKLALCSRTIGGVPDAAAREYIVAQEAHHCQRTLEPELRELLERHGSRFAQRLSK